MKQDLKKSSRLMGLLVACPFIDRLPTCPLTFMQNEEMHDRYLWMVALNERELDDYLKQHDNCFAQRHDDFMASLYNNRKEPKIDK